MTGAARRLVGIITVTTAVMAVGTVMVWRTVAGRPPLSVSDDATGSPGSTEAIDDGSGRGGGEKSGPDRGKSHGAVPVTTAAGAVVAQRENLPSVVTDLKAERAARAAAIRQPPQPVRAAPPPKPAEVAIRERLTAVLDRHAGTELNFVTCDGEGPPCRARVQARDFETVAAAARDASSKYQGHVSIKLHEQITAYNGKYFVAEMEVGTEKPSSVPTEIQPYP